MVLTYYVITTSWSTPIVTTLAERRLRSQIGAYESWARTENLPPVHFRLAWRWKPSSRSRSTPTTA